MSGPIDDPLSTPEPWRVLPIVAIVPAVAMLFWWADDGSRASAGEMAAFATAGAGLVGVPVLFWSLDHGRTRPGQLAALGACAAVVPLLAALCSGILGRMLFDGWPHASRILEVGAPIPTYGVMPWPTFLLSLLQSTVVGATGTVVYWLIFVRRWHMRA